jgi:hypothetical protein
MMNRRNDYERTLWVQNHEPLYLECERWKRRNKGGDRAFVRQFRGEIDASIDRVLEGANRKMRTP